MKQVYTKPLLAFEVFSAQQAGARDCADSIPKDQVTWSAPPNCVWKLGGGFSVCVADTACTIDGDESGFACYNNPGEGMYIFRS